MTERDFEIAKLFADALDRKDADAMVVLWRKYADWHGQNPDFATFLQEEQGFDAAGLDKVGRVLARLAGKQSTLTH